MKKNFILIISILMLAFKTSFAQNPPQDAPVMTLNVVEGSELIISLLAAANNTDVWIETSPGNYNYMTVGVEWAAGLHIVANSDVMRIYGNIEAMECKNNAYRITGLDVSQNPFLQTLWCNENSISTLQVNDDIMSLLAMGNEITELDVTHCQSLNLLYCERNNLQEIDIRQNSQLQHLSISENPLSKVKMGNNPELYAISIFGCELEACELDTIFYLIADRNNDFSGLIYLNNGNLTNPGSAGCKTDVAYGKYWEVQDYNKGNAFNIYGDGTGCDTQSVEQFNELNFNVMPNPVYSEMTIEIPNFSGSENFAVYDVTGKIVFEQIITENHATISLSSLNKGVYIVKIGTSVQKIVKM